ncbi:large conductance mechanosensitive channel protein MscL [Christensenellaceae bacterium OttesenSCG-928-K19]|nr:large conductance mechanosensitive channel protein MscL [Christensenellaceae bacterium OttesenSCG-928-K19]
MKKFFQEFKEFISRGSVMDLAVGVIIGSAFTAIVTALVENIINPLIELLTGGGVDASGLNITINGIAFNFGDFIGAVINFILVALIIFLMIKTINNMRKKEKPPETERDCPYCKMKISKEATKCPYCTADVEPETTPAPESGRKAPATRRRLG